MISRANRASLSALLVRWCGALLVAALMVTGFQPGAQAADDVSLTLTPSALSAGPGETLATSVTITNEGTEDIPAGEVTITAPSGVLNTLADLDEWYSSSDTEQTGRFLASVDVPAVAAGETVTVSAELPLASGRFGSLWGPRGLAADFQVSGVSTASARSSFVWTAGTAPSPAAMTTIVAIVPPADSAGVLSSQKLVELTGPSGVLTRQLQLAQGRTVALGVDPRIIASIAALGDTIPESVQLWLNQLRALPNESFLLPYANADISAQAQAGATTLLAPITTDIVATPAASTASATPTPTPGVPEVTTVSFTPRFSSLAWPAGGTVSGSDLGIFSANGFSQVILSSQNLAETASTGIVSGMPAVVTNAGLSSALSHDDVSRGASYLAAAALDPATGGALYAGLPRSFSITGLSKTGQMLDALTGLPWVTSGSLAAGLGSATTELALVDSPESEERVGAVRTLLGQNAQVSSFSTIAEDPSLITSPAARDLAAVLSVSWLGDPDWGSAVAAHTESTEKLLNSVSVVTSSTINMVGGQANIPISVNNALTQAVTVVVNADPNNGRLLVNGEETITIQPESQAKARIPVQAQVGNGSAILTVTLRSIEGVPVGQPVGIPVNVRADWETWGLTAVGIAFVGLITAGVIRTLRRRKQGQSEDV